MHGWRNARARVGVGLLATALHAACAGPVGSATPSPSGYLADVEIDVGTVRKFADESDNFHLTWHADDQLYGAYGDGWGFDRTDVAKRAIGVSRISGTPPGLAGADVWEGDAQGGTCCWAPWNGKSWGMLSTGDALHMWLTIGRPRALGFTEARLATSYDGGRSWLKADWAFAPADGVLMPSFLQAGKAYSDPSLPPEVTGYVYSYHTRYVEHPSHVQTPGLVDLMRAPRDRVRERAAYEFFAGADAAGNPVWSADPASRVPVLEKAHALDAPATVAWNPFLRRYIMAMAHVPAEDTRLRGVGIYEAERPWGPWFTVKETRRFAEGTIFFYQFPTKWMNADGSAWMAFTGTDRLGGREWDALNVVEVRFVPAATP